MRSTFLTTLAATIAACAALPARAEATWPGSDEVQRNGAVSRYVWKPGFGTHHIGGHRVSAGLAVGLRDALQTQLGRSVTPALTLSLGSTASVSLLPAGGRGAMLVLQATP